MPKLALWIFLMLQIYQIVFVNNTHFFDKIIFLWLKLCKITMLNYLYLIFYPILFHTRKLIRTRL
ncbi:hypothetical protein DZL40_08750 [Streptococcus pyogenes]|nr:hypothetical protein DZL40_08750 [Streptococcus pyogenes]